MTDVCPSCGGEYQRLAMHWNRSNCEYAEFTTQQEHILTGILMGDGDLHGRDDTNPHLRVRMTNEAFLDFVDENWESYPKGCFLTVQRRSSTKPHFGTSETELPVSTLSMRGSTTIYTDCELVHIPLSTNFDLGTTEARSDTRQTSH